LNEREIEEQDLKAQIEFATLVVCWF